MAQPGGRTILLLMLVAIWAGRLGIFLFRRILKAGKDARFDEIKVSFVRFLNAWTLQGLWVTLISPVFVTLLLTRISGVPILEKRADQKWGGGEDYEAYKERTPVLIPHPPRRGSKNSG